MQEFLTFENQIHLEDELCNPTLENFEQQEAEAEKLESEVEIQNEPEVIEHKPTVSELVKSLDLVKKYLQSHADLD